MGISEPPCSTLKHSCRKFLAFTCNLIAAATLLQQSAPSLRDSIKTNPNCSPSTLTSHADLSSPTYTIPVSLTLICIFFHTHSHSHLQSVLSSHKPSSNLPYNTRLFAYHEPGNLHSYLTFIISIPIFSSFVTLSIYTLENQGDMSNQYLMARSILIDSLSFIFTRAKLLTESYHFRAYHLH